MDAKALQLDLFGEIGPAVRAAASGDGGRVDSRGAVRARRHPGLSDRPGTIGSTTATGRSAMSVPFTPSREQHAVIEAYLRGHDLAVQAGAGTGKSATLALIADAQRRHRPGARAWYLTFNKRNADEVQATFREYGLTNARASTASSYANRACRATPALKHMVDRLNRRNLKIREEMQLLGIARGSRCLAASVDPDAVDPRAAAIRIPVDEPSFRTQRRFLTLTRATVKKFCESADRQVTERHVPSLAEVQRELRPLVRDALVVSGQRMWDELCTPTSALGTDFPHYLKAWALTDPVIGNDGDVILFDEAQDANPVLAEVILAQRGRVQVALVGDQFQQIYSFMGCIDAMQGFVALPDVTALPLTESRRFGPEIAAVANDVLEKLDPTGEGIRLAGIGPRDGYVQRRYADVDATTVTAVVCRTNALVIEHIGTQVRAGRRVHTTLDVRELRQLAKDVALVQAGRADEAKDVVLQGFTDLDLWQEWLDDDEPENEQLRDKVLAVLEYGLDKIEELAATLVPKPQDADVTVSTVHKAKGGTWDSVLVDMGEQPIDDDDDENLRLLYVALTRARRRVLWNPPASDGHGRISTDEIHARIVALGREQHSRV